LCAGGALRKTEGGMRENVATVEVDDANEEARVLVSAVV
jgi:hypothetical protein